MNSSIETWAIIPGFNGRYSASDRGRIRSNGFHVTCKNGQTVFKRPIVLKDFNQKGKGYRRVNLYRGRKLIQRGVHQLVALAFLGPRPPAHTVNHKDADKTNNVLTNLEYATQAEQMAHASRLGLLPSQAGESNGASKLRDDMVADLKYLLACGFKVSQLARDFGVSQAAIRLIRRGKLWKHIPVGPWTPTLLS